MSKRYMLSSLLVFFTCGVLHARPLSCPGLSYPFAYIQESVSLSTGNSSEIVGAPIATCDDVVPIADLFSYLGNLADQAELDLPLSDVGLNLFGEDKNASYAYTDFNLPVKIILSYPKHPDFVQAIWAHEFGHYIFSTNLAKALPLYDSIFSTLVETSKINVQMNRLVDEFAAAKNIPLEDYLIYSSFYNYATTGLYGEEVKKDFALVEQQLEPLRQKRRELLRRLDDLSSEERQFFSYANYVISALNEFFADTTAVIADGSGDVVFRAIRDLQAESEQMKKYMECRDFENSKNSLSRFNPSYLDIYSTFSPLRHHVWKYYLSRPYYQENRAEAMRKVYRALEKGLIEVFSGEINVGLSKLEEMLGANGTTKERLANINRYFIYYLDQEFSE